MTSLTETFAVSFSPDDPDFLGNGELTPSLHKDTLQEFADCGFDSNEMDIRVGSAGYGADAFILIPVFAGLTGLFLSGKKIEENLDAWVRLGHRFRKVVERFKKKDRGLHLSAPIALALTIQRIATELGDLAGLRVLASHIIPVRNGSLPPELEPVFESQPHRIYIFLFRLPNSDTCVVGIRSDGEPLFQHRLATGSHLRYFGIVDEDGNLLE